MSLMAENAPPRNPKPETLNPETFAAVPLRAESEKD